MDTNIGKFIEQLTKELKGRPECYIPLTVRYLKKTVALGFLLLAPGAVFAEVSDKLPSLFMVWTLGASAAAICLLAAYYRRWLGIALAIAPFLWFASLLTEIHSGDVGRHLYEEQGISYYVQSCLSLMPVIAGLIFGVTLHRRKSVFEIVYVNFLNHTQQNAPTVSLENP